MLKIRQQQFDQMSQYLLKDDESSLVVMVKDSNEPPPLIRKGLFCVRDEQMQQFEKAALRQFEDEMVVHLGKFSPMLFRVIGEDQQRKAISLGCGRAKSYGFTFRGPVRLFLEMMLMFGSHFDTDPQYPWAVGILNNQNSGSQMHRAEMLYEKTMDYLKMVSGPDDVYTHKAFRNISVLVRQPFNPSSENIVPAMHQELTRVHPNKAAYIGEEGLKGLINEGIDMARAHHFSTVRNVTLVILLMWAFGHGCGDDPIYPWIANTLHDGAIADPETRAKNLETMAVVWFEQMLANFEKGAKA